MLYIEFAITCIDFPRHDSREVPRLEDSSLGEVACSAGQQHRHRFFLDFGFILFSVGYNSLGMKMR